MSDDFDRHYEAQSEVDRLTSARGQIEFLRTTAIISRTLPTAPSVVADIGGGPGRYAEWLAARGHRVHLRDVVPSHIEYAARANNLATIDAKVADARSLDLADNSVDAALLLGPLYHLRTEEARSECLRELVRVVRPGGPVYIAAVSRWAQRLDGLLTGRIYRKYPEALASVTSMETGGELVPFREGGFTAVTHRPPELKREIEAAGLEAVEVFGVEGLPLTEGDALQRLRDPNSRRVVLESAEAIECVPELMGLSSHLLATARAPSSTSDRSSGSGR